VIVTVATSAVILHFVDTLTVLDYLKTFSVSGVEKSRSLDIIFIMFKFCANTEL